MYQQLKYTFIFIFLSRSTYFAMEVVEHQMMVGVVVVVHVLQGPEEDMIQAHLEGEGVVDHQGEEDLWGNIKKM